MTVETQLQNKKGISFLFGLLALALGVGVGIYMGRTPNMIEAIAILAGVVVVMLIFTDLDVGLVILIVMNYLRISQIGINFYGAPPTALPLTILLIMAIGVRWVLTKEAPKGWLGGSILIGLYGIVVFLSMFVAEDYRQALDSLNMFIGDAIVAITIMMMLQRARSLRGVVWALIICGIFVGTLNTYQFFTGTFDNFYGGFAQVSVEMQIVGDYSDSRIGGQIGDPNYFAEVLILIIPMAFYQIWAEKKLILKVLAAYSALICTLTLILTYSRGGFLALVVVALATMVVRTPKVGQVLLVLAFVIIIFRYIPSNYTDRIMTVFDLATNKIDPREEGSFRGRTGAMLTAWSMFKDQPFFGVGIDNYSDNYAEYSSRLGIVNTGEIVSPHNLYLEILAETGLAGFGTFIALLVGVYVGLRRSVKIFTKLNRPDLVSTTYGIMLALLGFYSSAMFIHSSYPRFMWMIIGIGLSVPIVAHNMLQEKELEESEIAIRRIVRSQKQKRAAI